jgi:glycerol-3-phosphate acyltransferase PlsX
MHIAVDAMGSDVRPVPDVLGALAALRRWPTDRVTLVGDSVAILRVLAEAQTDLERVHVVHAPEVIEMDDKPSQVLQRKRRSSMHIGLELVKRGDADAFVSAGNTGALWTIAALGVVRRLRGVLRPALGAYVTWPSGNFLIVDAGGSVVCAPEHLFQFACLGAVYLEQVFGAVRPRVALLSNGEESMKGSELTQATLDLLQTCALNVVGYAEPMEILNGGADVIVSDGFTGNIFVKTLEAAAAHFGSACSNSAASPRSADVSRLLAGYDHEVMGGALVLGLNCVVVAAHGASTARGMLGAIDVARRAVQADAIAAQRAAGERLGWSSAPRAVGVALAKHL